VAFHLIFNFINIFLSLSLSVFLSLIFVAAIFLYLSELLFAICFIFQRMVNIDMKSMKSLRKNNYQDLNKK